MADHVTIDFNEPVPLFPLPNCVLLPHASIPLRIFEPRYRTMVADAIDGRSLIAMATFAGDHWQQDYEGRPPLRPTACVGYILRHEQLDNGNYHIILQGLCRTRIAEELAEDTPYRQALLQPTEESVMEIDLTPERERLDALLQDAHLRKLASVGAIHHWLSDDVPTPALIDLAIMHLCDDNESRYRMLEEQAVGERARWLEALLAETRDTLRIAARFPEKRPDNYLYLN